MVVLASCSVVSGSLVTLFCTFLVVDPEVGSLKPPIKVRCHGFGASCSEMTYPADTHGSADELCEALSTTLCVSAQNLALFLDERLLSQGSRVQANAIVDVWPAVFWCWWESRHVLITD